MEANPQPIRDQFGDPTGGPQVGPEAVGGGRVGQPPEDGRFLLGGQERGPPGGRLGGQPGVRVGPVPGHPLGHRDRVDAEKGGDLPLGPPVPDPLARQPSADFEDLSRSVTSHPDQVTSSGQSE